MRFKQILESMQQLDEINMSPSSLQKLAANINAQAGMEFELIVPNFEGDDGVEVADYDIDDRTGYWDNIEEFFLGGEEYNSRREVERAITSMQQDFYEWVNERLDDLWPDYEDDAVYEYVKENASEDEVRDALVLDDDVDIGRDEWKAYAEFCVEEQNNYWDYAREEWFDNERGEIDEESWLRQNYPYMSDVENEFGLVWPYWTSSQDGEADIESIASDFESMIGKTVHWSSSYHGGKREPDAYTIEPDSSLQGNNGESGLEFISPPMSIAEMLSDLDKIEKWAGTYGVTTNKSTGLHMNVSIPDLADANLDYVKLALLLGDEYVLKQFGRTGNHYAKSAMDIIKNKVANNPETAATMLEQMRGHLNEMASKFIHNGVTNKFTSINNKEGYVEFRSPGGNWLDDDLDKVKNTLLRFVVALDAALDPEKYRQEYLKKLYALLSPKGNGTDTMAYFAKFVAGELPKAALKSFIKQAQLERKVEAGKTGNEELEWEVGRPGYGASIIVKARTKEEAIDIALGPDGYPEWASARNQLTAKPISVANKPKQQQQSSGGSNQVGQIYRPPAAGNWTGQWLLVDSNNKIIYKFGGIGNSQNDANRHALSWLRQNPEYIQQGSSVVPEMA